MLGSDQDVQPLRHRYVHPSTGLATLTQEEQSYQTITEGEMLIIPSDLAPGEGKGMHLAGLINATGRARVRDPGKSNRKDHPPGR